MEKNDNNIFDEVDDMDVEKMMNGDFSKTEKEEKEEPVKITPTSTTKKPNFGKGKKRKVKRKKKPFHIERYPHTHFYIPTDPTFDAKRYLYLLNSWLMSLTKLYSLLAKESKEEDLKITQEIYDMIMKLKDCINLLNSYLKLYCEKESDVLTELLALNDYIGNTLIPAVNTKLKAVFDCIENRLKVHDEYIGDVFNYIENIYEILQNIVSNDTQTSILYPDTDYTIEYYNGWYAVQTSEVEGAAGRSPDVQRERTVLDSPTGKYYSDTFYFVEDSYYRLHNSQVVNATNDGPLFRHSQSITACPESRKWRIDFKDANIKTPANVEQYGNSVCNLIGGRASWPVYGGLDYGSGYVVSSMVSIGDGINDQYKTYITEGLASELNFLTNTNQHFKASYVYVVN